MALILGIFVRDGGERKGILAFDIVATILDLIGSKVKVKSLR